MKNQSSSSEKKRASGQGMSRKAQDALSAKAELRHRRIEFLRKVSYLEDLKKVYALKMVDITKIPFEHQMYFRDLNECLPNEFMLEEMAAVKEQIDAKREKIVSLSRSLEKDR